MERSGYSPRVRPGMALAMLLLAGTAPAVAAERCQFAGTTSHDGRVAVQADVSADPDGGTIVDVTLSLTATTMWIFDLQYRMQEVSHWRGNELLSVAVNARYSLDGRIKRQQWDVFMRNGGALEGRRIQGKTVNEFAARYPGFASHWAPASFGQPWLQDYAAGPPERRPDLDLPRPASPPGLRTPLAMAFYWSRWLRPDGGNETLFLPGWKQDARADLPYGPGAPGDGWRRWQASLRHPSLNASEPSSAAVWVTPDGHLLQLAFDAHAPQGSASGVLRSTGCQGVQISPPGLAP